MDISITMLDKIKNSALLNEIVDSIELIKFESLFLTGGTLRNLVWNILHGYNEHYGLEDCDIIFYNPLIKNRSYEKHIERILHEKCPHINWSVKNQARMHLRNGHKPYKNISDALIAFPETCSAIGIGENWNIIAPYGLIDLFNFRVKPTTFCIQNEYHIFINRFQSKRWIEKWPNLKINQNILLTTPCIING